MQRNRRSSRCIRPEELWIREQLDRAIEDLAHRALPNRDLATISTSLDNSEVDQVGLLWPYFIPNDPAQCTPLSILNCSHTDQELMIEEGFVIEASSTRPKSFAKPYYIDPVGGVRRCKNLCAAETYSRRESWDYD